jgi:cytochrome c2
LTGGSFLGGLYLGDEIGVQGLKNWVKSIIDPSLRIQVPEGSWKILPTTFHRVVIDRIALPESDLTGGAIEQVGNTIVFATPEGRLGYVREDGTTVLLEVQVPMNLEALMQSAAAGFSNFDPQYIRVTDLLALPAGPGRYELLVSHHHVEDQCATLQVSRLLLETEGSDITTPDKQLEPLYNTRPCVGFQTRTLTFFGGHQAGGRMIPYDDDRILLTVGDHHIDGLYGLPDNMLEGMPAEQELTMSDDVDLGKILLIDRHSGAAEIFIRGLRNPQGLLRDSVNRIWETEHGPRGGDELNLVKQSLNYGWPRVTLGSNYGSQIWPLSRDQGRHAGFESPRFAWVPSIAISNLIEADKREFPAWAGDLIVSSLLEESLYRLRLEEDHVLYVEPISIGERIRDIIALDDGRIALYADEASAILLLHNGDEEFDDLSAAPGLDETTLAAALDSEGGRLYRSLCASCHSLEAQSGIGPSLVGVIGREVGALPNYAYSESLRDADRLWTEELLAEYITNPDALFPDTRMSAIGAMTDQEVEQLSAFLGALSAPR